MFPTSVSIYKVRKEIMSPVRTKYVPWFSSQLDCSQRDEPQPDHIMDQTEPPPQSRGDKRGKTRGDFRGEKTRCPLKVKLPKFVKDARRQAKTPRKWMIEPTAKSTMSRRGAQCKVAKTG